MQLFITNVMIEDKNIVLTEERVVYQMKNVLRVQTWYTFLVQEKKMLWCGAIDWVEKPLIITRYMCRLSTIDKKHINAEIVSSEEILYKKNTNVLCVALPNKFEKLELIVQKCTELWLQHMIFYPSQYSQLRDISEKKWERLWKIALEAVEQSKGVVIPEIVFVKNIQQHIGWNNMFVLHQDGILLSEQKDFVQENHNHEKKEQENQKKYFFVWPEWWRWGDDENIFHIHDAQKVSLGKNILRTETAAIIVAWELVK